MFIMSKKPILYLVACNHFDLAWRRPFRTNMDNKGETFIPYAKIEQYYIEDNMALCDKYPEYKFCIESVSVVREFLKNRPDLKDKLFRLAKEGRAFIPGSGDVIVDSNLILGETILNINTRLFCGGWWGKGEPLIICADNSNGIIENITITDVYAESENGVNIVGKDNNIKNVVLNNFAIKLKTSKNRELFGNALDLRPNSYTENFFTEPQAKFIRDAEVQINNFKEI